MNKYAFFNLVKFPFLDGGRIISDDGQWLKLEGHEGFYRKSLTRITSASIGVQVKVELERITQENKKAVEDLNRKFYDNIIELRRKID